MGQLGQCLFGVDLKRVDPEIDRRALGKRTGFFYTAFTESLGERAVEPFRIVARHGRRGIRKRERVESGVLGVAKGLRCEAFATAKGRNLLSGPGARKTQSAEKH